jgi:hypothetical protein
VTSDELSFVSNELVPDLPGELIGYLCDTGVAVIESVQSAADGRGDGTALVRAFERWAAEHGATTIRGESMADSVGFWRKMGYEVGAMDEDIEMCPFEKPCPRPTVRFDALPEDMRVLIEQFVLDFDPTATIPGEIPLVSLAVADLPEVELDESDRGTAYALRMRPGETPPIIVADGCFMDGKHRVFAARARGDDRIVAMDLSGVIPARAILMNSMGPVGAGPDGHVPDQAAPRP